MQEIITMVFSKQVTNTRNLTSNDLKLGINKFLYMSLFLIAERNAVGLDSLAETHLKSYQRQQLKSCAELGLHILIIRQILFISWQFGQSVLFEMN